MGDDLAGMCVAVEVDAGRPDAAVFDAAVFDAAVFDAAVFDAAVFDAAAVDACVPLNCMAAGTTCGPLDNGCGDTLACGLCMEPSVCADNTGPNSCSCTAGSVTTTTVDTPIGMIPVGVGAGIAADAAGVHISYSDGPTSPAPGRLHYAFRDNSTGDWTTEVVDDNGGWDTMVSLDSAGGVHLGYKDKANEQLMHAYRAPGGGAWTLTAIDEGNVAGRQYDMTVTDAGAHFVYDVATNYETRYALHSTSGTVYVETVVDGQDLDPVLQPAFQTLAVDATGGVHVAMADITQTAVHYSYRTTAGNWSTVIVDTESSVGRNTDIAVGTDGSVHISYSQDAPDESLKYAYRASGSTTWDYEFVHSTGGEDTAILLDELNRPHIVYYDPDQDDLLYAYNNGSWQILSLDTAGDVGFNCAATRDANGWLHVAYMDVTNSSLKYAARCP